MAKIFSFPQTLLNVAASGAVVATAPLEWASYYGMTAVFTIANQSSYASKGKFQWSHDKVTWFDVPNGYYTEATIGANGKYGIFYKDMVPAQYVRAVSDRSAGTADVTITMQATKI